MLVMLSKLRYLIEFKETCLGFLGAASSPRATKSSAM